MRLVLSDNRFLVCTSYKQLCALYLFPYIGAEGTFWPAFVGHDKHHGTIMPKSNAVVGL